MGISTSRDAARRRARTRSRPVHAGQRAAAPHGAARVGARIGSRWRRWPSAASRTASCSDLEMHDGRSVLHGRRRSIGWRRAGVDLRTVFFITGADAFRDIRTLEGLSGDARPLPLRRGVAAGLRRPARCRQLLPELAARMIDGAVTPCRHDPTVICWWTRRRRRSRRPTSGSALASGRSIDGLVPPAVAAYIEKHGLYRTDAHEGRRMAQKPDTPTPQVAQPAATPPARGDHGSAIAAALDKKALDLVVLDLRKGIGVHGLLRHLHGRQHAAGAGDRRRDPGSARARRARKPALVEGYERGEWVLHRLLRLHRPRLHAATREFYGLERLWGDAERVEIPA